MNIDFKRLNCCRPTFNASQQEKAASIHPTNESVLVNAFDENRYENIFKLIKNLQKLKRNEQDLEKYFVDSREHELRFQSLFDKSVLSSLGINIRTKQSKDLQTVDTAINEIITTIDQCKSYLFIHIANRTSIYKFKNEINRDEDVNPPVDLKYDSTVPNFINYLKELKGIKSLGIKSSETKEFGPQVSYLKLNQFSELLKIWQEDWLRNNFFNREKNVVVPLNYFQQRWREFVNLKDIKHLFIQSKELRLLYEVLREYFGEKILDKFDVDKSDPSDIFKVIYPTSKKILDINDLNFCLTNNLNIELLYGTIIFKSMVRKFALGKGTYGKVFLAQSIKTNNYYAVKMCKKNSHNYSTYQKFFENCLNERDLLIKTCGKPFVVKLLAAIQTHYEILYIMQFVSDITLETIMQEKRDLSESELDFYSDELTYAVFVLHSFINIMHRDLKPNNILIDKKGHIILADFGWAKPIVKGKMSTRSCQNVIYRAPEVSQGNEYDYTIDCWSIGVILYFLATNENPIPLVNQNISQILNNYKIPYNLKIRLEKLLNKNPKNRIIKKEDFEPKKYLELFNFKLENPNPPKYVPPEKFENIDYTENLMLSELYTRPLLNWGVDCEPGDDSLISSQGFTWFNKNFCEF